MYKSDIEYQTAYGEDPIFLLIKVLVCAGWFEWKHSPFALGEEHGSIH